MMTFEKNQRITDIVRAAPATARAFERLGIDYCCRGAEALGEACERAKVPLERALGELMEAARGRTARPIPDSIEELIGRIVDEHHAFTRDEFARLEPLCAKVVRVHGERHPELRRVAELFAGLRDNLLPHMLKEERVLFPAIRSLATGASGAFPFGSLENPLAVMDAEHNEVGAMLEELSTITQRYVPPEGACGSYRALYAGLADLQQDVHEHVYLENHVLFPFARELQARAPAC